MVGMEKKMDNLELSSMAENQKSLMHAFYHKRKCTLCLNQTGCSQAAPHSSSMIRETSCYFK